LVGKAKKGPSILAWDTNMIITTQKKQHFFQEERKKLKEQEQEQEEQEKEKMETLPSFHGRLNATLPRIQKWVPLPN